MICSPACLANSGIAVAASCPGTSKAIVWDIAVIAVRPSASVIAWVSLRRPSQAVVLSIPHLPLAIVGFAPRLCFAAEYYLLRGMRTAVPSLKMKLFLRTGSGLENNAVAIDSHVGIQHGGCRRCKRHRVSGLEPTNDRLCGEPRIGNDDSSAIVVVQFSGCIAEGPPIEVDNLDAPSHCARELCLGQLDRHGNCLCCDEGSIARA